MSPLSHCPDHLKHLGDILVLAPARPLRMVAGTKFMEWRFSEPRGMRAVKKGLICLFSHPTVAA